MEWNRIVPGLKEAMILAVGNNDWSAVRGYIEDIAPKNSVEYTQLQQISLHDNIIKESCARGFTDLVSVFLNNGFPVDNAVDNRNKTMLFLAVSEGHFQVVELLIKSGADINRNSNYSEAVLHSAVQEGHFLLAGVDINTCSKYCYTALHLAASRQNIPVMNLLVENGADVNITNCEGTTALHLATKCNNIAVLKFLIEHGADVNITNCEGTTALHLATKCNNIAVLKFLIEHGADVNITDKHGINALYIAVLHENLQVVKFLIEHGSQINIIDNICQETPLSFSILLRNFEITMLLINHGADLNLCIYDQVLQKAVTLAVPVDMIECLLEHGASVTAVNEGRTALQHTMFHSIYTYKTKLHISKFLLIYGSNHHVEDDYGNTVLHWACEMGDVGLVEYLIDYGLNVDAKNREGKKPYDIAIEKGHNNIVKALTYYHCNKYKTFD